MYVAFWHDYAAKSEFRFNAFSKKNQLFPVTIKIISDIKIEFWFKKSMHVAFLVWSRGKKTTQVAFSEKNHIFLARNQKQLGRQQNQFRFKKVSGLLRRAKECVMDSCSIGSPPSI